MSSVKDEGEFPQMKFTPTEIVCEACINPMHIGHRCRQFIPFSIEIQLSVTVASLPKRLRSRVTQGRAVRRGEQTISVSSVEGDLVDELLTKYGQTGGGLGQLHHFTMIARLAQDWRWPAWVCVNYIHRDQESPYRVFMLRLRRNICQAIDRGIAPPDAVDYLFIDGREKLAKAEVEAEARRRGVLLERATVAVRKLRELTDYQIATLAAENAGLVDALETLVDVPMKEGK